jgi:hypothetical protein
LKANIGLLEALKHLLETIAVGNQTDPHIAFTT